VLSYADIARGIRDLSSARVVDVAKYQRVSAFSTGP
jgi:hypothetical protein